ncbi:MAG: insulinase family protein, partial [Oscillospiraceae bacterium]|nr:insulinase family protein [Oscillospiraceae bacterium]
SRRSVREMAVSRPQFAIGAKVDCPTYGEELLRTRLLGDLAATFLAGTSTPLYARLYESGKIAKDFGTYFDTCAGAAFAMLSGEGDSPEEVYDAVIAEAERIGETGGDRALFDRLKKAYIGGTLRALNSFDTLCYNGAKGLFAGYDAFNEMSVLDRISYEDVCSFTGRYFTHEKTVLSVVGPFKNN